MYRRFNGILLPAVTLIIVNCLKKSISDHRRLAVYTRRALGVVRYLFASSLFLSALINASSTFTEMCSPWLTTRSNRFQGLAGTFPL